MARRVEQDIARLGEARDAATLRKGLADRVGLVAAKAAKVAASLQMQELVPDLLRAFDRLFENPLERDPQCWGKNAIAKALVDLDYRESAPYMRGARWVQMEPVWGGKDDTAATLRGTCVLALAGCRDIRLGTILQYLVDALTEKHQTVRQEAARALAELGTEDCALLLRLKARTGDEEPAVIGQVFDSLLRIEGESAVEFIGGFLNPGVPETFEEAALALGGSRLPPAVRLVQERYEIERDTDLRLVLLRALSLSRDQNALEFLLNVVRHGLARDVAPAIEALAIHRESHDIWQRVAAAAEEGGNAARERFAYWSSDAIRG